MRRDERVLLSIEQECQTTVDGTDDLSEIMRGLHRLLAEMQLVAPSLPGHAGFYNGYGRIYEDCGHLELAAAECDSPYHLAQMCEQQNLLLEEVLVTLHREGLPLRLVNNNYSGLLHKRSATWGAHENYWVERHPTEFGGLILPFLASRLYAGAGAVRYPTAQFVASARAEFLQMDEGGGTTRHRALHSTCREEHLSGPRPTGFRYHLIAADGHRSQFNLALQMGATALVLKAITRDRKLPDRLRGYPKLPLKASWLRTMRKFNVLGRPGHEPRVDPTAIDLQREYLDSARRTVVGMAAPPTWAPRILEDWQTTLDALERGDRAWLASHLDAFAKYELFSSVLAEAGVDWRGLRRNADLFYELQLLDHDYHDLGTATTVFRMAEADGMLTHRVCDRVCPGMEPEPYVPETTTRAAARARFIESNAGDKGYVMDWVSVLDRRRMRRKRLDDPFADAYGPWQKLDDDDGIPF